MHKCEKEKRDNSSNNCEEWVKEERENRKSEEKKKKKREERKEGKWKWRKRWSGIKKKKKLLWIPDEDKMH